MLSLGQINTGIGPITKKHSKRNCETQCSQVTILRVRSHVNGRKNNQSKSYYPTKIEKLGEIGFLTGKIKIKNSNFEKKNVYVLYNFKNTRADTSGSLGELEKAVETLAPYFSI